LLTPRQDSLRLVLDHGRNFIDLEEEDGYGQTSLLRLLASPKVTTEKIDLLLARGANPKAFAKDGCSCLHYCVERSKFSECLGILKLLIRAGADVHAVGDDGTSVTTLAYGTPEKGYRWGKREISNGNRGMIWEQALTDCGYNAAEFRQAYLDAGGYVLEDTDYLDLDSDSGKASNDSDGSEAEELTHSGPEGKRLGYAGWKEQQRGVDDQDWDPISVTGFNHVVLPSLQDRTLNPHAGDTDLVLPSIQNTLDWQHTVSEVSPVAASSPCSFRRSFYTLSTQHDHVPIVETKHADNGPRAWNNSSQSNNESCHQRLPDPSDYQEQQPQTDNTPWDYNFTTHQNEALQPDTWLRIQDLHLLEGDANVWSQ